MVIISAKSDRKGARQGRVKVPQCRSAKGAGQVHSKLCHHIHSGGPFSFPEFPGTLGQRGGRVTGKWTLAPHYIKEGTVVSNRENPQTRTP